jgi:hypothetical protein
MLNQIQFFIIYPPPSLYFKIFFQMSQRQRQDSSNFLKNPAAGGQVRSSSSPDSPAVGKTASPNLRVPPFQHAIFLACFAWRAIIHLFVRDDILHTFAREYAEKNPAKGNGKLQFLPSEVEAALAAFQREFQLNHQGSLYNQFCRISSSKGIAPHDDIHSFAEWYIFERMCVPMNDAANPNEHIIKEMMECFKSELHSLCPEWYFYKYLFGLLTPYVPLAFLETYKQDSLSMIRRAFGGAFPQNGVHRVNGAFVFRYSEMMTYSKIYSFLNGSNEHICASPALMYSSNEKLFIRKTFPKENLNGIFCVVFIDRIGEIKKSAIKSALPVVKTGCGDGQGGTYGENDHLVESGFATAFSGYDVVDELVVVDYSNEYLLHENGFPGWNKFMEEAGAFPFQISFD